MTSQNQFFKSAHKIHPAKNLHTENIETFAFGTDASLYRLTPKIVIKVNNEKDVINVIKQSNKNLTPLTFRAAGTSLSGQAITDSVLVLLSRDWCSFKILNNGEKIKLDPAVIGGHANVFLSKYNRKIGPDPASINHCMISGIAANNSSGMTSGTKHNIYNTLVSMRIILNDGTILDTADEKSKNDFKEIRRDIYEKVIELSQKVKANSKLSERIKFKYRIKNTCGYGLNSLVDFDDPFEIIQHLMIGSEGTLGFISNVTLKTVDNFPFKATSLLFFNDIKTACSAIPILQNLKVDAAEIMNRTSLKSIENKEGVPDMIKNLNAEAAALLIETSADNESQLKINCEEIINQISNLNLLFPVEFVTDKNEYKKLWDIRKGMFPSVCNSREIGTTAIIEDLNFSTEQLANAVLDLETLLEKFHYKNTIIFGHALSGNIHFVLLQNFGTEKEILRYKNFMYELAFLVVKKYNGSLKAEHGTGRNMAPFVKYEWGAEAYEVMKEIKNIFDPENIFNPGVLINDDPLIHIKNLKPMPRVNELIDKCIECGFCENNCPSKNLTLTPRQRITVLREIERLKSTNENPELKTELINSFKYFGNETCATDGLCAAACPVDINTGKIIKVLRSENNSATSKSIAAFISSNFAQTISFIKLGLDFASFVHGIFGTKFMYSVSSFLRKISFNKIPMWNEYLPKTSDKLLINNFENAKPSVVYFPSCINRTFGLPKNTNEIESQTTVIHKLLLKAGYNIIYPNNINNLCCGMPFESKGFFEEADKKSNELLNELIKSANNYEFPILFDTSPCLYRIKDFIKSNPAFKEIKIYEPVEFISEFLIPKLEIKKVNETIVIHSTCSSTKLGLKDKFKTIAEQLSENVIIPEHIECCGFAGDRGFSHPELNQSALKNLKQQISINCREGFSTSKTCEIGLSSNSGIEYKSIFYLLDKAATNSK